MDRFRVTQLVYDVKVYEMEQGNVVYIGRKPVMAYCLAVMTALKAEDSEVTLMARGRAISKAVDVAEVVRNQFMADLSVKDISIGTEQLENEDGSPRNISNISIQLAKD
jgi:DNA-binding protein